MRKYLISIGWLGVWVAMFGLLSCSNKTTQIVIGKCRDAIDTLEIFVWKPSFGNPFSGVCDDSKFQNLENGNPVLPAHTVSPKQGERFDLPALATGEQLLFRYKRANGPSECEPCVEGTAAGGDTPCTITGPSWCRADEPTDEPQAEPRPGQEPTTDASSPPEPGPEPGTEPRPPEEPTAQPEPEPNTEPRPEPGPEPRPEPGPESSCMSDRDCKGGLPCINNVCRPCVSSKECPAGAQGNPRVCVNGACVEGGCLTIDDCKRRHCPPGASCQDAWLVCLNNQCVKCRQRSDCGAGKVCDYDIEGGGTGFCLAGDCESSSECTGGKVCRERFCTTCNNDKECEGYLRGSTCQRGTCIPAKCRSYLDCADHRLACIKGECVKCNDDHDCDVSQRCSFGSCYPITYCTSVDRCYQTGLACATFGTSKVCQRCGPNIRCTNNYICAKNLRCQPPRCLSSSNCFGGWICKRNTCTECSSDLDCGRGQRCLTCTSSPGCTKVCGTTCPKSCR